MKSINELQQRAESLRHSTRMLSISPEDNFGLLKDSLDYLAEFERGSKSIGIRKVYPSIAAMLADGDSPIDTNGHPLRYGQLVIICDMDNLSMAENGFIYAYQDNSENPWLLIGDSKNFNKAQAELIAETIMDRFISIPETDINNITNL